MGNHCHWVLLALNFYAIVVNSVIYHKEASWIVCEDFLLIIGEDWLLIEDWLSAVLCCS